MLLNLSKLCERIVSRCRIGPMILTPCPYDPINGEQVQNWLGDSKHVQNQQVQLNLTTFKANFKGITGLQLSRLDDAQLRRTPFSIDASAARSNTRTAVLNAIDAQKQPYTTCRTDQQVLD